MKIIKCITIIAGLLGLSACSHSNVSGEWECPRLGGHGCINIAVADEMAMKKVRAGEPDEVIKPEHNYNAADDGSQPSFSGKFRKVWFAPFTDSLGNWHEASVVYYQE